jgi:hypothetical protein
MPTPANSGAASATAAYLILFNCAPSPCSAAAGNSGAAVKH